MDDWGRTTRKNKALLSRRAYTLIGKYDPSTMVKRFGSWSAVPQAFRKFARGKRKWAYVVALLPSPLPKGLRGRPSNGFAHANLLDMNRSLTPAINQQGSRRALQLLPRRVRHAVLKDRPVYGNMSDFPGLGHEPVNEQGVVLLFGMLARSLGYTIEAVQTGFSDCEAMRQIAPGRWQRVRIEFEYESKNFHTHGHSVAGCDIIVCWRHNWPACPKHLEVLELSA